MWLAIKVRASRDGNAVGLTSILDQGYIREFCCDAAAAAAAAVFVQTYQTVDGRRRQWSDITTAVPGWRCGSTSSRACTAP